MPFEFVACNCDYNHTKSGNIRVGHDAGYAGCLWHHRGRTENHDTWPLARLRQIFGPSLAEGSRTFHETFGSDDELIARQSIELGMMDGHYADMGGQ